MLVEHNSNNCYSSKSGQDFQQMLIRPASIKMVERSVLMFLLQILTILSSSISSSFLLITPILQVLQTQNLRVGQETKPCIGLTQEELDKELLLYLPAIYTTQSWSMLQHYMSDPKVHASTSCPLLIHHASTLRPPCFLHVP